LVWLYQLDSLGIQFDPCLRKSLSGSKDTNSGMALGNAFTKCGSSYYDSDPAKCLIFLKKGASFYKRANNEAKFATNLQNIAFTYEEKLQEHSLAASRLLDALSYWKKLNNELNTANLYKYMGLVQGRLKKFDLAKLYIDSALILYDHQRFDKGIAVSYFNLALVYREQKLQDSALTYLSRAKNIWTRYNDTSRLFKINNEILAIRVDLGHYAKVEELIRENQVYLDNDSSSVYRDDQSEFLSVVEDYRRRRTSK
jgi:tetratricopeptide (TPR) repeat protein